MGDFDEPLVSVVITVGPDSCYKEYLVDAVQSVLDQTYRVFEIILIDDAAEIDVYAATKEEIEYSTPELCHEVEFYTFKNRLWPWFKLWVTPWNLGYAQAFNCGVGLVHPSSNLIMCLAADDKLMPDAVKDCVETYQANNNKDAWYNMSYELQDGTTHSAFNNICMVTKNLWKWLGGYPPSGFAAPDALLISILMKHAPDRLIKVKEGKINCWLRQHKDQDTLKQAAFFMASGVVNTIRNMETERFVPNKDVKLR